MNRIARGGSRGVSLVELCVGAGVLALLAGAAIPALTQFRREQALRAAADALASDLRLARSEAARTGDSVYFRVSGKGSQSCYLLHTGTGNGCDCSASGQASCTTPGSAIIKAEWLPRASLLLRSNAETFEFQFRQGLVTQTGSIDLSLVNGPGIRQVVAIIGRVRSCYIGAKLSGLPKCA
ncbi:GspH/FimT family pseudopilin [Pelomonas sp. P7]|uniref:Type II secretion system protein H n=1 Tax=Pelomonas caseinilytica TaxID=2906763 RepID=A0ABS8XME7_9BURK|nr:GspH/FimT family pseudopilin [Pelomonas sp. P7]MCE4539789.1 GspH/FimT family pseudopilin [Pelomonas sp. P7]